MNPDEWKNDPRLSGMDPVKLQYIEKIAAQISARSKSELLPALLKERMKEEGYICFDEQIQLTNQLDPVPFGRWDQ